ncbi:MAG: substrate-binding domain-containing protein, partial [Armatimonadota bacterium]|nr:substrate-binding domain-containing protein [Armatimonadota bacterium]
IIVSPSGESPGALAGLLAAGIPVVQVDRRVRGLATDAVVVDNRAGVFAAVEHLVRLGHRRIALIGGPGRLYTGRERTRAFRDALRRLGLPLVESWLLEGTFKVDSGYRLAARLFESSPRPTAVFVANNLMTIGALLWFKQAGVRIPDDIAVVGFDDMDWAPILTPPLTAVAQPTFDLGKTAATLLLGRLQDPFRPPRLVVLPPRLVVRESCGARLAHVNPTGSRGDPTLSIPPGP